MIQPGHELSIKRQAELLNIARGSAYYVPRPVSDADQALMQRIDRLVFAHAFAEEAVLWPAVRRVLPDGEALTLRIEEEHQEVNELVAALDASLVVPMPVGEDPEGALATFLKEMNVTDPQPVAKLTVSISTVPQETTVVVLDSRGKV